MSKSSLLVAVSVASGLLAAHVLGCSVSTTGRSSGDDPGWTLGDDAGGDDTADGGGYHGDAGSTSDRDTGPTTPATGYLRFLHAGFQTGTVDFCTAPAGSTTFTGPRLQALGVSSGADMGDITRYLELPAGSYDVVVVAPGKSCTDHPFAKSATPVQVTGGSHVLALLAGNGGLSGAEGLAVTSFVDAAPSAGSAKMRFINAGNGLSGTASVTWSSSSFGNDESVFSSVKFRAFGSSSPLGAVSSEGYLTVSSGTRQLTATGEGDFSGPIDAYAQVSLTAGSVQTLVLAGYTDSGFAPLQVLVCDDAPTVATSGDALTQCASGG